MPIDYNLALRVNPMQVETPVETKTRLQQLANLTAETKVREAQAQNLGQQSQTLDLQNQQLQRTIAGQRDVEDLIRQNMSGGGQQPPPDQSEPAPPPGGPVPQMESSAPAPQQAQEPGIASAPINAAPAGQMQTLQKILPPAPRGAPSPAAPPAAFTGQSSAAAVPRVAAAPIPQAQGAPTAPMPQMNATPQGTPAKVAGISSVMPNWNGVIQGLYARGRVPEAQALQKTILDNQKLIGDVDKLHLDNQKTQIETSAKGVEFIGQILGSAHDQISYNAARGVIAGMGLPTNDLPPVYDKAVIDQHVKEGLTIQQQLEAQTRELDDYIKRQDESRKQQLFPVQRTEAEQKAITATQEASGTKPMQPTDIRAARDREATAAETRRHDAELEKTAAGRLDVERRRFAQTTGGVELTPTQQSIADKLASGDFNPAQLSRFPDKEALTAAAIAKNPNWSPQTYATKKAFEDPQSKQSQNLGTISRIVGHIGRFEQNSKQLGVSPSFMTGVNLSGLAGATHEDAHAISSELEKLVSGGVGTVGQVREWQKSLTSSMPAIRQQAVDEISQLIGSQYEGMNQTYKTTIGSDLPIDKYVSPGAREWMKAKGINAGGTASPGAPGANAGGAAGKIVVTAPDGSTHPFDTQAQADAFKKLAHIQ